MIAEYIAKIGGDISDLEKQIKKADGKLKRLEDNIVKITFQTDGDDPSVIERKLKDLKGLNPELDVQLKYDYSKKQLDAVSKRINDIYDNHLYINDPDRTSNHIVDLMNEYEKIEDLSLSTDDEVLSGEYEDRLLAISRRLQNIRKTLETNGSAQSVFDLLNDEAIEKFQRIAAYEIDPDDANKLLYNPRILKDYSSELDDLKKSRNELIDLQQTLKQSGAVDIDSNSAFVNDLQNIETQSKLTSDALSKTNTITIFDGVHEHCLDVVNDFDEINQLFDTIAKKMKNPAFHFGDMSKNNTDQYTPADDLHYSIDKMTGEIDDFLNLGITGDYYSQNLYDILETKLEKNKSGLYVKDLSADNLFKLNTDDEVDEYQQFIHDLNSTVFSASKYADQLTDDIKKRALPKQNFLDTYQSYFQQLGTDVHEVSQFIDEQIEYVNSFSKYNHDKTRGKNDIGTNFVKQILKKNGIDTTSTLYSDSYLTGSAVVNGANQRPYDIDFNDNEELAKLFYQKVLNQILSNKIKSNQDYEYLFDDLRGGILHPDIIPDDLRRLSDDEIKDYALTSKIDVDDSELVEAKSEIDDLTKNDILTPVKFEIDTSALKDAQEKLESLDDIYNSYHDYLYDYYSVGKHDLMDFVSGRLIDSDEISKSAYNNFSNNQDRLLSDLLDNRIELSESKPLFGQYLEQFGSELTNPLHQLMGSFQFDFLSPDSFTEQLDDYYRAYDDVVENIHSSAKKSGGYQKPLYDLFNIDDNLLGRLDFLPDDILSQFSKTSTDIISKIESGMTPLSDGIIQFQDALRSLGNSVVQTLDADKKFEWQDADFSKRINSYLDAYQIDDSPITQVSNGINDLKEQSNIDVKINIDDSEITQAQNKISELREQSLIDVKINVDDSEIIGAQEKINAIKDASLIDVKINVNDSDVDHVKTNIDNLKEKSSIDTNINVDNSDLIKIQKSRIQQALESSSVEIPVVPNVKSFMSDLKKALSNEQVSIDVNPKVEQQGKSARTNRDSEISVSKIKKELKKYDSKQGEEYFNSDLKKQYGHLINLDDFSDVSEAQKLFQSFKASYQQAQDTMIDGTSHNTQLTKSYQELKSGLQDYILLRQRFADNPDLFSDADLSRMTSYEEKVQRAIASEKEFEVSLQGTSRSISEANKQRINFFELGNGTVRSPLTSAISQIDRIKNNSRFKGTGILNSFENIQQQMQDLQINGISSISDFQKYADLLSQFRKQKTFLPNDAFKDGSKQASDLLDKISSYMKKYTGISKPFKDDLQSLFNEVQSNSGNLEFVNDAATRFNLLKTSIKEAGQEKESFFTGFQESVVKRSQQFLAQFFSIMDIVRYARELFSTVTELDSAMTELNKVSDVSSVRLDESFQNSAKSAKELGTTITDVVNSTADWSRLGYSIDESEQLARITSLYQNVGDNIDQATASSSLVSTLQGFKLDTSEAMSIVDKFNEVGNNFAIDTAGIGEALQRSAASFNESNTDLSEAIALIAGTNEVIQDPESVGNMWKTVSMRIRGATAELEAAGEDTDGVVTSTSKLRDIIQGMTGFDIMEADGKTFKSMYDIILGIGEAYEKLDDVEQASLLEKLAGKNRSNALAAAFGNLDTIREAYATAEDSAGSASREQEKYAESIQYSVDRAKASIQELASDFLSSDLAKGMVDFATTFINAIDQIVKSLGGVGTLLTGGGIGAFISNFKSFYNTGVDKQQFRQGQKYASILNNANSSDALRADAINGTRQLMEQRRLLTEDAKTKFMTKAGYSDADQAEILSTTGAIEAETAAAEANASAKEGMASANANVASSESAVESAVESNTQAMSKKQADEKKQAKAQKKQVVQPTASGEIASMFQERMNNKSHTWSNQAEKRRLQATALNSDIIIQPDYDDHWRYRGQTSPLTQPQMDALSNEIVTVQQSEEDLIAISGQVGEAISLGTESGVAGYKALDNAIQATNKSLNPKDQANQLYNKMAGVGESVKPTASGEMSAFFQNKMSANAYKNQANDLYERMGNVGGKRFDFVDSVDDALVKAVDGATKNIDGADVSSGIKSAIANKISSMTENIGAGIEGATSGLKGAFSTIGTNITTAFEGLASQFVSFIASPVGMLTAGVGAVMAIAKIYDMLHVSAEEAAEKADEAGSDYQNAQAEADKINSQIETNTARIKELQELSSRTIEEEAELQSLQNETAKLKGEASIKNDTARVKQQVAAEAALQALNVTKKRSSGVNPGKELVTVDVIDDIAESYKGIDHTQKKIDELQGKINTFKSLSKDEQKQFDWEEYLNLKDAESKLELFQSDVAERTNELADQVTSTSDLVNLLFDENGNALVEGAEDFRDRLNDILLGRRQKDMSKLEKDLDSIQTFFDGSSSKNRLRDMFVQALKDGESLDSVLRGLGLTLEDLGFAKENIADGSAIESLTRYFQQLADQVEDTSEQIAKFDGTKESIQAAIDSKDYSDTYDTVTGYVKTMKDLYDAGKTGKDDFQAMVEYFTPGITYRKQNGIDTEFDNTFYASAYENIVGKLNRYFVPDDTSTAYNESLQGVNNATDDLIAAGLAFEKYTDKGEYEGTDWTKNFTNSAQAAKAFGLSVAATEDILHNMEDYGAEFSQVAFSGEMLDRMKTGIDSLKDYKTELKEITGDSDYYDNLLKQYNEYEEALNDGSDEALQTLEGLTEDQIIHIEFVVDQAKIQKEIDRLRRQFQNSGSAEDYAIYIAALEEGLQGQIEQTGIEREGITTARSLGYRGSKERADKYFNMSTNEDKYTEEERKRARQKYVAEEELQRGILNAFSNSEFGQNINENSTDEEVQQALDQFRNSQIDITVNTDDLGVINDYLQEAKAGSTITFDTNLGDITTQVEAVKDQKGVITYTIDKDTTQSFDTVREFMEQEEISDGSHIETTIGFTVDGKEVTEELELIKNADNTELHFSSSNVDTSEVEAALEQATQSGIKNPEVVFTANVDDLEAKVTAYKDEEGEYHYTVTIDDPNVTEEQIQQIFDKYPSAEIEIKANVDGVEQTISAVKDENGNIKYTANVDGVEQEVHKVENQDGTCTFTADTQAVKKSVDEAKNEAKKDDIVLQGKVDNIETKGARSAVENETLTVSAKADVDASEVAPKIEEAAGNSTPKAHVDGDTTQLQSAINGTELSAKVKTGTDPASYSDTKSKLNQIGKGAKAVIDVEESGAAEAKQEIDQAAQDRESTITVKQFNNVDNSNAPTATTVENKMNYSVGQVEKLQAQDVDEKINYTTGTIEKPVIPDAEGTVVYGTDTKKPDSFKPSNKTAYVIYYLRAQNILSWTPPTKTGTVNYTYKVTNPDFFKDKYGLKAYYTYVATNSMGSASFVGTVARPKSEVEKATRNKSDPLQKQKLAKKKSSGKGKFTGTAFANGTFDEQEDLYADYYVENRRSYGSQLRSAYAHGNWGLPQREKGSLVNEVGAEIIVNPVNSTWQIVNNGYPAFVDLPKGAIIFNHLQTEQLLRNGNILGSHGKQISHATGTVGSSFANGIRLTGGAKKYISQTTSPSGRVKSYSSSPSTSAANTAATAASKYKEDLDWIEILLNRIETRIDDFERVGSSAFENLTTKTEAYQDAISLATGEIIEQQKAVEEYTNKANAIGLSEVYKQLVRDGSMAVEVITNEDVKKNIDDYKTWYEKAIASHERYLELAEEIKEYFQDMFDAITEYYEGEVDLLEHRNDLIESYIDLTEEQGHYVGDSYYTEFIDIAEKRLAKLREEQTAAWDAMVQAIANGVEVGSKAYFDMYTKYADILQDIADTEADIQELRNDRWENSWDIFDDTIDKIDDVIDELEFLENVASHYKLFDEDTGEMTDYGQGIFGTRAMRYDVYMKKAQYYADEIKNIEKELSKEENKNNQKLIERRLELLDAQREAIENAYDEKDAIKDLVADAYDAQLNAFEEIINKKKEMLDLNKDEYDYAKDIAEKQKEINRLQKQYNAYQGDDSEEGLAKRQKLQADLQEAQEDLDEAINDKRLSDTEALLDGMYSDLEEFLNNRLDDLDGLIIEQIDAINNNGQSIADTLNNIANKVGYNIEEALSRALSGASSGDIVSDYDNTVYNNVDVNDTSQGYENTGASILGSVDKVKSDTQAQVSADNKTAKDAVDSMNRTENSQLQILATANKKADWNKYGVYSLVYDYEYYKNHNKDLQKAYGDDEDAYFEHFVKWGMSEGRQANEQFDPSYYRYTNADLNKAYGNNWASYYQHYMNWGVDELRNGSSKYSGANYKKNNPDLQNMTGRQLQEHYVTTGQYEQQYGLSGERSAAPTSENLYGKYSRVFDPEFYRNKYPSLADYTDSALFQHFLRWGVTGGLQGNATFDVKSYKNAYQDLRLKFGNDWESYFNHYMNEGYKNRDKTTGVKEIIDPVTVEDGQDYSAVYDYNFFRTKYPDVKAAFGDDDIATLHNFVRWGMEGGRQGNEEFNVDKYKANNPNLVDVYGDALKGYYMHYIWWGKKAGLKAYAKGAKKINGNQYGVTNEDGAELILQNGGVLTPLKQGDRIYSALATDTMWNFANNPESFLSKLNVPSSSNNIETENTFNISINVPNVTDYRSFINEMRNDTRFEQLVQEITIGRLNGNNSLAKYSIKI